MISVNGKRINIADENDPFAKEVKAGFEKLRAIGFPLTLIFTPNHISPKRKFDPDSKEEHAMGVSIVNRTVIPGQNGDDEWMYFKTSKPKRGDKPEQFEPRKTRITPYFVINETDIELAFYLVFKSGSCEKYPDFGKEQYVKPGHVHYRLSVRANEEMKIAESRRLQFKINALIYDNDGIGLSVADLCKFAETIGIKNPKSIGEDELKNRIYAEITNPKKRDMLEKFFKYAEKDEKQDLKIMIEQAIARKVISIEEVGTFKHLLWVDMPVDQPKKIFHCGKTKSPDVEFVKLLQEDEHETEKEEFIALLIEKMGD